MHDYDGAVIWIISTTPIKKGEEITISYLKEWGLKEDRHRKLVNQYGIQCKCKMCLDPNLDTLDMKIKKLDDEIGHCSQNFFNLQSAKLGLSKIKELTSLYEAYPCRISHSLYSRRFYDGFQLCGAHKSLHQVGEQWIELSYKKYAEIPVDLPETKKYRMYLNDPFTHPVWKDFGKK